MLVTGGVCLTRLLTNPLAPSSFGAWIRYVDITQSYNSRYSYLRGPDGRFRNPYDHGIKKNCSDFWIKGYNEDVECVEELRHSEEGNGNGHVVSNNVNSYITISKTHHGHMNGRVHDHEATTKNIYRYSEWIYMVDIGEETVFPKGVGKHIDASRYLIAGGVAGAVSRTATAPLDRLKVVLQVQTTRARIMPAIKDIWREGGFLGFFRGNGLNVLKVAPESAIRFYTYEMLKTFTVNAKGEGSKTNIGAAEWLLAGSIAGAVTQTAIYPMDLVKTRLQTYASASGKIPSLRTLSKDIWVQEGPRAFYKGLIPSLLGIIPYVGIDLAAYETLKDMSKKYILLDKECRLNALIKE